MKENKTYRHPLTYMMWIVIASIIMMFAGLSSAFIIKRAQTNWISYEIPLAFYYSTAVIIISSVAIIMAKKAFVERRMNHYTLWLGVTTAMGILFVLFQYIGFKELWGAGITVNKNVAFSFLYVLVGLHVVHVLGGVVSLIIMFLRSLNRNRKVYSPVYISVMATYWHFVDILWLYLLLFLIFEG